MRKRLKHLAVDLDTTVQQLLEEGLEMRIGEPSQLNVDASSLPGLTKEEHDFLQQVLVCYRARSPEIVEAFRTLAANMT